MFNSIKRLGNGVLGSSEKDTRVQSETRIMAEQASLFVGVVFLLLMGVIAVIRNILLLAYIDAVFCLVLILCFFLYKKTNKKLLALTIAVFTMIPFFLFLLIYGGEEATTHVWFYTFPLFSMHALGSKRGTAASMTIIFLASLYFLFQNQIGIFSIYKMSFILRFIPAYFAVALFSFVFKKSYEISQNALVKTNTELEEAKTAAEAASSSKSRFLANISHELRTPLNHVIGFSELVLGEKAGPINETQREFLSDAVDSGQHLLLLINDLLDLSRVEAGKLVIDMAETDLAEIIRESLAAFSEESGRKGITLSFETIAGDTLVLADKIRIKQVFYNLIANSFKFTDQGGSVCVELSESLSPEGTKEFLLRVIDTGIGMRQEDLELIFHPFEQADSSRERKYPGAGLGLALSRELIQAHGGRLWAESLGPGFGSTFFVALPAATS